MFSLKTLFVIMLSAVSLPSLANDIKFNVGVGYPFFSKLEIAKSINENQDRIFANYKVGLDDGFSLGYEHAIDLEQHHAFGVVVGAIGARDGDGNCNNTDIFCDIGDLFDNDTTNGLAISYSYNINGLNKSGLKLSFELGYGKASHLNEKRVDGGVSLSYQF
jgi:hypothetical protein